MSWQRVAAALILATGVCTFIPASSARGQSFDSPVGVETYRFLPRSSVVNQQGGIAGFDINYHVRGTFDFRVHPSLLAVYPPVHVATFEKVDAVGVNPRFPDLDVDAAFNLSGIHGGERLTNPRMPGVFHFQGKTDDGSSVTLHARVTGPWLYLRGRTTAPEGSADFFEYTIKALARRQPDGDFNSDGVVDGSDIAAWRSRPTSEGSDLLTWQRQLGEAAPSIESLDASLDAALAATFTSAVAAVPEPAAAAMVLVGVAVLCGGGLRLRGR